MAKEKPALLAALAVAIFSVAAAPATLADHSEVTVVPAQGSGVAGCETTPEGCFIPSTVTVDVGGAVTFSNTDTVAHTFAGGTSGDGPSGEFDSSLVMAGASYEFKTEEAGEIPYFCIVHPWMEGLIVVQRDGDAAVETIAGTDTMTAAARSSTSGSVPDGKIPMMGNQTPSTSTGRSIRLGTPWK